tara:strand:+ start:1707 stop:2690 length:984 start_codon:yes stop_codon:yes gene_type:complete
MSKIYELVPQMRIYSKIGYEWKPFIMNIQESKYRSKVVNTDNFGLRFNNNDEISDSIFNNNNFSNSNAIVGASTVFGVGSSQDKFTIPSLLTKNSDNHFFNIGARAYSGFQEIIFFNSLLGNMSKLKQLIVFSGVNDIFMNSYINNYDKVLGPMFFNDEYKEKMSRKPFSFKEDLVKNFLQIFPKNKKIASEEKKIIEIDGIFKIIKRNLICWSNIKHGLKLKLVYFLQPMANWCKRELSDQEKIIFGELEKNSSKTNMSLKYINIDLYNEYKRFLNETCKDLGIDFFDCNDHFSNKDFNKKWLFVDRVHLTDLGNELISEYIKSKI